MFASSTPYPNRESCITRRSFLAKLDSNMNNPETTCKPRCLKGYELLHIYSGIDSAAFLSERGDGQT